MTAFVSSSLTIACIVKTRERFMGIGQLLTMPLFFSLWLDVEVELAMLAILVALAARLYPDLAH